MTEIIQPYVTNLVDKNSAKNKKMLNLVSEMDDHYRNGNYKIHQRDNTPNDSELKRDLKPALNARSSSALNQTKMEKVYEQTSSLFNKEFYDTNINSKLFYSYLFFYFNILVNNNEKKREIYKLELVPKDPKNAEFMSSDDVKNIFAKKGFHAFDIKKLDFAEDHKNKENFRMNIRKNNAYNEERFNKVLNDEAEKNGFKVRLIEEPAQMKKKKYLFLSYFNYFINLGVILFLQILLGMTLISQSS